ncbi:ATP-binding protein [Paenibacillus tarimensis]
MEKKLLINGLLPIMIGIISFSSIYMDKTTNAWLMIAAGAALFASFQPHPFRNHPFLIYAQSAMLVLFHLTSALNWTLTLYVIVLVQLLTKNDSLARSFYQALFVISVYSVIRLSYTDLNSYALLNTFADFVSSMVIVALFWYIKKSAIEKDELQRKNNALLRLDTLTGLLNFQAFREDLDEMCKKTKKICIIFIDCYNIRTLNIQQGYREVNNELIRLADQLQTHFPHALISRYSGGEYAIAFEYDTEAGAIQTIEHVFNHEMTDFKAMNLLYGFSLDKNKSIDGKIDDVESQLFDKKREYWVKRDEHFFRADKLKVIGELAAGMAHEIRNPLTTIKGFLQLAYQNDYNNMNQFHGIIMSEITRVSELTSEFLQFSKPHFAKLKPESVQSCISRAVSVMDTEISRLGHTLLVETAIVPLLVEMERDKMVQVLVNMMKNAIEAMDSMGNIRILAYSQNHCAIIEISDSGNGMCQATMDKLFDPFFTTKEHGTGLGMSITHKIIQDFGGSIKVDSVLSEGTTFIIRLPLYHT